MGYLVFYWLLRVLGWSLKRGDGIEWEWRGFGRLISKRERSVDSFCFVYLWNIIN